MTSACTCGMLQHQRTRLRMHSMCQRFVLVGLCAHKRAHLCLCVCVCVLQPATNLAYCVLIHIYVRTCGLSLRSSCRAARLSAAMKGCTYCRGLGFVPRDSSQGFAQLWRSPNEVYHNPHDVVTQKHHCAPHHCTPHYYAPHHCARIITHCR
jgi:hypothetical protein